MAKKVGALKAVEKEIEREFLQAFSVGGIGTIAFALGLVISIAAAFLAPLDSTWLLVLGVLGIIVGVINVTARETVLFLEAATTYLVASVALLILVSIFVPLSSLVVGGITTGPTVSLAALLINTIVFLVPAAWVVAFRAIIHVAKSR